MRSGKLDNYKGIMDNPSFRNLLGVILKKNWFEPYIFILPAIIALLIFKLLPILNGLKLSFFDFNLMANEKNFVGFSHYKEMVMDNVFRISLINTLKFNFFATGITITLALALALFLNRQIRGIGIFRTIYFVPVVVSLVITSLIWMLLYDPNNGLLNSLLQTFGIPRQRFLNDAHQALGSVIAMVSWKGIPYWMIILLAGLQGIPDYVYEAAKLDGGNRWQIFRYLTLPLMSGTLLFVIIADTSLNFLMFAPIYLMTQGGPENTTTVLMFDIYRNGFIYNRMGYASAVATVLLMLSVSVAVIQKIFLHREVKY